MDKVLNREQAAKYIKMEERSLSRLMQFRLIPFIKTHFRKNPAKGRVYFSKKKLDEWMAKDEDLRKMTEAQKNIWKVKKEMNIASESSKEAEEQNLALEILKLSKTMLACLDEAKHPNLSEKERARIEEHSEDLSEYLSKIPELHAVEKKRLIEFFDEDMDCLFHYFPKTFEVEIKARKRADEVKPKEMRGGIPIERFETSPGTKKPRKQQQATTIEQADNYEVITRKK